MVAPAAPPDRGPVALSDEQQYVINLVTQGYNVFFTGSAGLSYFIWVFSRTAPDSTQARANRSACGRSSASCVNMARRTCSSPPVRALRRSMLRAPRSTRILASGSGRRRGACC